MKRFAARAMFHFLSKAAKPIGGVRPRRVYHSLARIGFERPEFAWYKDRFGYEFRLSPFYFGDRHVIAFGAYDDDLVHFLDRRVDTGSVCLDVGANIGLITVLLGKRVGPSGRVYSFEPAPTLLQRLRENVQRNHLDGIVQIENCALAEREGMAEFHFATGDVENQGMGSLVSTVHNVATLTAPVVLTTLDSFAHDFAKLDLVKVDVQGGEIAFLEGARRTIARLSPDLLIEVSHADLNQAGSSSAQLCLLLDELGYRMHALERGRIGKRLKAKDIPANFDVSNLYCTCH